MASANFTTTENPLSSPWVTVTGGGALRATGGECANAAGSDTDSGARYSSSSVTTSIVEYRSGTFDGGPALFDSSGNGYLATSYSGTTVELYRIDGGFPNYNKLGTDGAVTFSAGDTAKLDIVGNDIVFYKGVTEIFRQTDTTHRTGLSPGIFEYAGSLRLDNFTDGAAGGYSLTLDAGSYALTGQAVSLRAARRLTAASGSYTLSGQAIALRHSYRFVAEHGSYSLSGQSITLIGPTVGYSISLDTGFYTFTGSDASVDSVISIGTGTYTVSGQSIGLKYGHKVQLATGSYALSGQAISLKGGRRISIDSGSYSLNGQDVSLRRTSYRIALDTGLYVLDGRQVSLIGPNGSNAYITYRPNDPFGWWRP